MKTTKKLLSILLAMVMLFTLALPAFAATGTITIKNATVGETYSIYKIFDATYTAEDSDEATAAYTIHEQDPWYTLVSAENSPFSLTEVETSDAANRLYNVSLKDRANISNWLNNVVETLPAATASKIAESAEVKFEGVEQGYYLVKSTLNEGGTLTVDNANPNATVIDKNQAPGAGGVKKEVTAIDGVEITSNSDKSAEYGDTMTFKITYTATNYNGDKMVTNYKIEDNMPDGLGLVAGSVAVKVGNDSLQSGTGYTITYGTPDTDDFTINIPWTANNAPKYASPVTIEVTYSATVLNTATINGDGNTNTAKVTYTDADGDHSGTTDEAHETVYTYALAVKKVNDEGTGLNGAQFTLKDSEGNVVKVSGSNGVYEVNAAGTATIESPDGGLIVIKGVKGTNYTLTEDKAPAGYNRLTAPITVTPTKVSATTTDVTIYLDAQGNVVDQNSATTTVTVEDDVPATAYAVLNLTGTQLPSTGGIGTTIFYVVGGLLVLGAAVVLVSKKRMGNQQ